MKRATSLSPHLSLLRHFAVMLPLGNHAQGSDAAVVCCPETYLFPPLVFFFFSGVTNELPSTLVAAPKTARRAAGTLSGPATFTSSCFLFEFNTLPYEASPRTAVLPFS